MIRLTDEEIQRVYDADFKYGGYDDIKYGRYLAEAQSKKFVEWGNEECIEHPTCETTVLLRRECDDCWQALSDEVPAGDSAAHSPTQASRTGASPR